MHTSSCQRFTVYVLRLSDGRFYVGSTGKSLAERIYEHRAKYGTVRRVGELKWCTTRGAAVRIEKDVARKLRAKGYEVVQG